MANQSPLCNADLEKAQHRTVRFLISSSHQANAQRDPNELSAALLPHQRDAKYLGKWQNHQLEQDRPQSLELKLTSSTSSSLLLYKTLLGHSSSCHSAGSARLNALEVFRQFGGSVP